MVIIIFLTHKRFNNMSLAKQLVFVLLDLAPKSARCDLILTLARTLLKIGLIT